MHITAAEHCGPAAPVYLVPVLQMWNIFTLFHGGAVMWSQMQTLQWYSQIHRKDCRDDSIENVIIAVPAKRSSSGLEGCV